MLADVTAIRPVFPVADRPKDFGNLPNRTFGITVSDERHRLERDAYRAYLEHMFAYRELGANNPFIQWVWQ